MITLKLKIGKSMLEYQADEMKKIHAISSVYGALPDKCDACQSEDIYLSWRNFKDVDYYSVRCKKCGAELSFHQRKAGGFFLKEGEKMTVYNPDAPKDAKKTEEFDAF